MKSGGGLLHSHQREELKGFRKAMGTSANQYRKFTEPTTHLAELKRMIESSKMLSKINICNYLNLNPTLFLNSGKNKIKWSWTYCSQI